MVDAAIRREQRLTWKEQVGDWVNPPPVVKLLAMLAGFIVSVGSTLLIQIEIRMPLWFALGLGVMAASAVFAAVISQWRSLWRFEAIAPWACCVAIASVSLSIGAQDSPMEFATVLPVIWFAALAGRRYVLYALLGSLGCMVLPVLASDDNPVHILVALSATIVLTIFAFIYNEASNEMRKHMRTLRALGETRDRLLEKAIENGEQLKTSEAERHAAERMLRGLWVAVTEQAAVGTDLTGLIDVWNPGAVKMLHASSEATEGRRSISEFHLQSELDELVAERGMPQSGDPGEAGFAALVEPARRGESDVRDWTYRRDDGSEFAVQVSVTARLAEDGTPMGYLFVANDLTAANERSRLKDEFVSLISHELRTPLSSILGYLELMRDDEAEVLSATQLQYLDVAERNAHRLLRLVGDLLFTAQVESGEFHLNEERIDLQPLVIACVESAGPAAANAGVSMVSSTVDGAIVQGDPVRLGQAVDNLISNAIKFTPRGGSVSVKLAADGPTASITIGDTGMGIPADELDRLFSRFFRATTATRNAIQGVGLGLTITKSIVTAHRGRMTVESEEGVGTSFSILLPRVELPAPVDAVPLVVGLPG